MLWVSTLRVMNLIPIGSLLCDLLGSSEACIVNLVTLESRSSDGTHSLRLAGVHAGGVRLRGRLLFV